MKYGNYTFLTGLVFYFEYMQNTYNGEIPNYGESVFLSRWCREKIQSFINSSNKCTRVCTGILLVPVSVSQPNSQNLCEAEEESYATNKSQHHSSIFFHYWCTWSTMEISKTISGAGFIRIKNSESTTIQISLNICSCAVGVTPSHLQKFTLLFLIQCQTGTGDRKLDNKDQQKNNHVKEQQYLMMFHCTDQSN